MEVHIEHVQLESIQEPNNRISTLQVSNNIFVLGLEAGQLIVIDLDKPSVINKFRLPLLLEYDTNHSELSRGKLRSHRSGLGERLLSCWINGDGTRLFIKTSFAKYYLLDIEALQRGDTNCLYTINRFAKKNFDIDVVYWYTPWAFVCSSTTGYIYSLDFKDNLGNPRIVGCSNTFVVKKKPNLTVDGILFDSKHGNMLLATRNKLMYWKQSENSKFKVETPLDYLTKNVPPSETEEFNHLQERHSETTDPARRFASINGHNFAWLTNSGVVYGNISPRGNVSSSSVLNDAKILLDMELPPVSGKSRPLSDPTIQYAESVASGSLESIRDVILTDFHMVILRDSTITVVNQLTNHVVFQEVIVPVSATDQDSHTEKFLGLAMDNRTKTFWCYSTTNVYEIILNNESKVIWKILCSQGDYDTALKLKGLSQWELDEILYRKGESLLRDHIWLEAAKCYGQATSLNIGSIALKFLTKVDVGSNDDGNDHNDTSDTATDANETLNALQEYLMRTLNTIKSGGAPRGNSNDKDSQRTVKILLSSWIVFNFMKQLNDADQLTKSNLVNGHSSVESRRQLQQDFETFLTDNRDCLDDKTVYQIISSQNRKSDLLFFAQLINDYEYIISYWIKQENWYEALRVLLQFHDSTTVYKYSTILLVNSPEATVNTWMKIPNVNPTNLLQAILTYFTNYQKTVSLASGNINPNTPNVSTSTTLKNYGLLYLIWYIETNSTKHKIPNIIYNTVLYMMITDPVSNSITTTTTTTPPTTTIIEFLETYHQHCDLDFILRLSLRYRRHDVSIHLLTRLKLYEDAINLAVENDMTEDAKYVIRQIGRDSSDALISGNNSGNSNSNDTRLKRRLWLKVSRYLLARDGVDVREVTRRIFVESDGLIGVKDLLPLFSEITTVGDIKDELIKDLESHGERMSKVAVDIQSSINLKKKIRVDIEKFGERYRELEPGVSCSHCYKFLQDRKFFVFPCDHCYHKNCLVELILHSNDYNLINELQQLMKKVQEEKRKPKSPVQRTTLLQSSSGSVGNSNGGVSEAETKLENLLGRKCYLCSEMNINKIDDPLTLDDAELLKWRI